MLELSHLILIVLALAAALHYQGFFIGGEYHLGPAADRRYVRVPRDAGPRVVRPNN